MAKILTLTLNPALDLTVELARLEPGQVNRSDAMHSHAAGKGVNVAQVLADLGHTLTVSGFLGEDNAQAFETLFAQRGFTDAFIRVPGETRSNIKLAEQDGRITDLNGPGPKVDDAAQQALLERLERIAPGHDAVVVAGSLPRGVSPQWLQALITRLKTLGLKVALDTSGEALRVALAAGPWLIKPNTEELADALGCDVVSESAQVEAAQRLHAQGVEQVVISHGADGVNWFSAGSALHASPPRVTVASTVGAGDSLLAGMLHGLLGAHTPEQTLRTATAIAAMAVTQIGFGIRDTALLASLEQGVRVRPLTEQ
ncbi:MULTISPECIES: 1-phosphofructokinase [Pseudomonas]|uniref:1-phosphofructokinase n=1 Tax=Pseudomonas TaxID=286 RepID=UPI000876D353|nr:MULTISPECIES: 1-phosphofructokinase [Pseudomonas]MDT8907424.1 1-phosphofructokinase [Pseudomonas prosekii]NHN70106.1 1-phosphofructokinase [Pseudomonas fluorescens]ROO38166.1 1-phosphofructokinase [Pseudomonas sp. 7SR1]ROO41193.1 1-phosphofructokinase [Pseudomonas sp. AF76]SCX54719.1 1-phosphofructokinase [Pseudomonas sp. NFACC32-1]